MLMGEFASVLAMRLAYVGDSWSGEQPLFSGSAPGAPYGMSLAMMSVE